MSVEKLADKEIEERRVKLLNKADEAYYDINSPHYKDNERFSWAVREINKYHDELLNKITKTITMEDKELRKELPIYSKAILDKGYATESIVEVLHQTAGKLMSLVTDGETQWHVMTYRLTELNPTT